MTSIGDIVFTDGGGAEKRLKPLTVRQLCTLQQVMARRKAAAAAEDCRAAGMDAPSAAARAAEVREQAMLTSWMIRWAFELDGAVAIVAEACGSETVDGLCAGMAPDELTELALRLIGFEWDDTAGKWTSRSASKSARGIGSQNAT